MRKQHKKYKRPKTLFESARIEEENALIKQYGLKNKKEIWKADSYIGRIRNQAKKLLVESKEKQKIFLNKLANMGLIKQDALIEDVLSLTKMNLLERRLQTILKKMKLTTTPKQARQLIAHRHVLVDGRAVNVPSFIVPVELENKISLKIKQKKKTKEKTEEAKEEQVQTEQKEEIKEKAEETKQ